MRDSRETEETKEHWLTVVEDDKKQGHRKRETKMLIARPVEEERPAPLKFMAGHR